MGPKKILITGGAGFIGYYITKELLSRDIEPIIYDAFLNYIPPLESRYAPYLEYRLNGIKNKVHIIRGDIRNRGYLIKALKETEPDTIIHLAAIPIAQASNQFSEEAMQINLNGTVTVLECIRVASSVKRFIYASSSFIYGDFIREPADENHPTSPIDIYGGTKLSGEILTKAFGKKYGIEYSILRPSAVYGPTDANRRVTQIFVENAILGKPIFLHNGGIDKVDFTYVKDTAHGFVLAALSEKAKNETFNITYGSARSTKEFADILKRIFPELRIEEGLPAERRPKRGSMDIRKAKRLLGYEPQYDLEKGVSEYVDFIISNNFINDDRG
ncbi:MAG: GDP-mannose 4,6-dehydratase [Candidatus Omnitrophica bacterium]|nr:GDP-mannose 4,6-dehydratase [Candidatus Omnitrophota bacterium]